MLSVPALLKLQKLLSSAINMDLRFDGYTFGTYFSQELEIANTTSGYIWAQNISSSASDENLNTLPGDLPRPLKFELCSSIYYGIEDLDGGGSEGHLYGFRLSNHDRC